MDWMNVMGGLGGLAALGVSARWNWWRLPSSGIPVLMYHKVGTPPPGSQLKKLWVSPDDFRWQMAYLKRKGFHPVTFQNVADAFDNQKPLPNKPVIMTLDDGYRNNYDFAFPILKEFQFPAVIYIVVNAIEKENAWHNPASEPRVPMLSWGQIQEMGKKGIEFGSHTLTHPRLTSLSEEEARAEIFESRRRLSEKLGNAPVSFAYPYGNGQDDERLQRLVKEAGYRWACSVHRGLSDLKESPFCLNRVFIRGDDTRWDFQINVTRGRSRF